MEKYTENDEFIRKNSPNGDFLQSENWRKFQDSVGRRTFFVEKEDLAKTSDVELCRFSASIIEHELPIVGKYFYVPRGPVMEVKSQKSKVKSFLSELIEVAKKEHAGWIRIEPATDGTL